MRIKSMERLLAIESSSPVLSLALGNEFEVLNEYQSPLQWRHAESLFEGLQKVLAKRRWSVQTLTGVAVSTGPGSFTGIRIGLAAARALGQSLKIPVVGMSSLETLAYHALRPDAWVCPVIDALRGEVFTALYERTPSGDMKKLWKEIRLPLPVLLQKLKSLGSNQGRVWMAGDIKKNQAPGHSVAASQRFPRASALLALGQARLRKVGRNFSYERVLPLYLRSAAAQERNLCPRWV